jgi:hypothetical protein
MNAFKDLASANVNKVVLEFGLQVGEKRAFPTSPRALPPVT